MISPSSAPLQDGIFKDKDYGMNFLKAHASLTMCTSGVIPIEPHEVRPGFVFVTGASGTQMSIACSQTFCDSSALHRICSLGILLESKANMARRRVARCFDCTLVLLNGLSFHYVHYPLFFWGVDVELNIAFRL